MMMNVEHMKQSQAEMIKHIEEEIIQESLNKNGTNMELKRKLHAAIIRLDRGKNDECLSEICSLVYLPGWVKPKLPHNPNRKGVEEWVKLETYINSLMAQTEVANSILIYEFIVTRTCNAIFVNMRQVEQHHMEKHSQNLYGFST